jgi:hypothetical protein
MEGVVVRWAGIYLPIFVTNLRFFFLLFLFFQGAKPKRDVRSAHPADLP